MASQQDTRDSGDQGLALWMEGTGLYFWSELVHLFLRCWGRNPGPHTLKCSAELGA